MVDPQKPFESGANGSNNHIHHFHHIWCVQGLSEDVNTAIQAALPDEKKELFDPSRKNFWFEGPYKELRRLEQTNNMKCPVFIPWETPDGYTGDGVDPDVARVGREYGIEFVAVDPAMMKDIKEFDNFVTKPLSHGVDDLASPHNQKQFESLLRFSDIMADAIDAYMSNHNMDSKRTVINVQNKYMIGVPLSLREKDAAKEATITYFSHIPIIPTSKPKAFEENADPAVVEFYAETMAACDAVNIHSSEQVDALEFFVEKHASVEQLNTTFGTIFLGIDQQKWVDIIRAPKAWEVAKDAMYNIGNDKQMATMYGRLDVFKGLDIIPKIVGSLMENKPEHQGSFSFTNVFGRVNTKGKGDDPFSAKLEQVQTETDKLVQEWGHVEPFHKYEIEGEDGARKEFLGQDELGGLMIATMLSEGVVPVTSVEEGLHMGVFEFITAAGYYLLDNPDEFKENCVKILGMDEFDSRIENASIVPWVSKFSGAAFHLNEKAGDTTLIMDPNDIEGSATTLHRALTLSRETRMAKLKKSYQYVQENGPAEWVNTQLLQGEDIARAKLDQAHVPAPANENSRFMRDKKYC